MASTRSTQRTSRSQPSSADSPGNALAALARRAPRMQIAGCAAAATSFAGWAQSLDRFAQSVGDELQRRIDGEADSADLVAHVSRAAGVHLHELSAMPSVATHHFDARIARVPNAT